MTPIGHGIHTGGQGAELDLEVHIPELLGTETLLYTQLGGQETLGKMFDPRDVEEGEVLRFRIALDKVHLFDAKTGMSVRLD